MFEDGDTIGIVRKKFKAGWDAFCFILDYLHEEFQEVGEYHLIQ